MKKLLKMFSFGILPVGMLLSFIFIGKVSERNILDKEGTHHTMSGAISSLAWTYRGIFIMLLIILFSYVLYSKISNVRKVILFLLILILNLPLMYFMELAIFFPVALLIIPILNIIAVILVLGKRKT